MDTKPTSLTLVANSDPTATPWSYFRYAPPHVKSYARLPLLVSLHGTGSDGSLNSNSTGWPAYDAGLDAHGRQPFIEIFPQNEQALTSWSYFSDDDVAVKVVAASISDALRTGCIDPQRIYVDGWSAGAYLAQRLACSEVGAHYSPSFHIARIAEYAGGDPATSAGLTSVDHTCAPKRHIPLLMIHDDPSGGSDSVVATQLGYDAYNTWAVRFHCHPDVAKGSKNDVYTRYHSATCPQGIPLVWVPAPDLNHVKWSCSDGGLVHDELEWNFLAMGRLPRTGYTLTCPAG